MKAKVKSYLILIVTFAMGIILGIVLSNTLMRSHYRGKVDRLRTPDGFIAMYERIIQPEETQRDTLHVILRNHFEKMRVQGETSFQLFHMLEDSLYKALEPVLSEEQNQRLLEHLERMKKRRDRRAQEEKVSE